MNMPTSNTSRDLTWVAKVTQAENDAMVSALLAVHEREKEMMRAMNGTSTKKSGRKSHQEIVKARKKLILQILSDDGGWLSAKDVSVISDMKLKIARNVLMSLVEDDLAEIKTEGKKYLFQSL